MTMRRFAAGAVAAVVFLSGCGGDGESTPTSPAPVASVAVTPTATTITESGGMRLGVELRDGSGNLLTGRTIVWTSSASTVVSVDSSGFVRALAVGTATISATSEGHSGTATITVIVRPVARVTVTPATPFLALGGAAQLSAATYDAQGQPLTGRVVTWASSAAAVVSVDGTGVVRALSAGSAIITATSEGKSASATVVSGASVTVTLGYSSLMPGQTTEAQGVLHDGAGATLPNPVGSWASSDTTVAIAMPNGFVVAVGSGTAMISGTSQGATGSAPLVVQAMPSPVVSPVIEYSPPVYPRVEGKGLSIILDASAAATAAVFSSTRLGGLAFRRLGNSSRFIVVLSDAEVAASCDVGAFTSDIICATGNVLITDGSPAGGLVSFIGFNRAPTFTSAVTVTPLGPMIQRTAYAVNIRDDGLRQTGNTTRIAQLFYQFFGDNFEYIALSELATTNGTIFFSSVRNRVTGIGLSQFDVGSTYGSSANGKLLGFLNFRNYFDLAHQVTSHEMAHAFCCFIQGVALSAGSPHWPLSTTAFAIMGSNGNPGSNAGYAKLTPVGNGSYRVDDQSPFGGFNNLELYLLGLASANEVEPQVVFQNQVQSASVGQILQGPTTTVTINDIIAANGARTPGYSGSPVAFHLATIVVSRGRLLTPAEMAYFDQRAQRGEATTALDVQFGIPFFVNTRGRGILVTRIP